MGGWRKSNEDVFVDFDGTEQTIFHVLRQQDYEQWSAELRLTSNLDGPVNFVAGGFHFESEYALQQAIKLDLAAGAGLPIPIGAAYVNGSGDGDWHKARTTALFLQGDAKLTDRLTLTLGGRAIWDKKKIYTEFYDAPFGTGPDEYRVTDGIPANRVIGAAGTGGAQDSWFQFTPKVSLSWQPYDNLLFYASYSKGYNAGGFSARTGTVADVTTPYNPESISAYEVGVKSDLLDNRLRINAAIFLNKYSNKQEEAIAPTPPLTYTSTTIRNAATAEIAGFELEVQASITDEFRLDASFGYLDARYTKFDAYVGSSSFVSTPPQPAGTLPTADLSGLMMRRAPRYTFSLAPSYETRVGDGFLMLGSVVRYIDK